MFVHFKKIIHFQNYFSHLQISDSVLLVWFTSCFRIFQTVDASSHCQTTSVKKTVSTCCKLLQLLQSHIKWYKEDSLSLVSEMTFVTTLITLLFQFSMYKKSKQTQCTRTFIFTQYFTPEENSISQSKLFQ